MPLLQRETELYPENLFELAPEPWWVAHVRSRQEKALGRHLLEEGVPYYLPQWENRRRRGGRSFVSYLPLFPGYVFFRGSLAQRKLALRSNVIVRVLEVKDQNLLQRELASLFRLQQTGEPLVPHPYLAPGDEVQITEGPFKGWVGQVLREKGIYRLVVSVTLLRRAVAVELDRELLAPVRPVHGSRRPAAA